MRKLFLCNFYKFYGFIKIFSILLSDPGHWLTGQFGRPCGRPNQGPVDPDGRPTRTELCTSGSTVGRSAGRPTGPESSALCSFRSTGRSTVSCQRSK